MDMDRRTGTEVVTKVTIPDHLVPLAPEQLVPGDRHREMDLDRPHITGRLHALSVDNQARSGLWASVPHFDMSPYIVIPGVIFLVVLFGGF